MHHLLDSIYSSSLKLLVPTTLQETYKTIVEEAIALAQAKYGTLFLGDPSQELRRAYTNNPEPTGISPRSKGYTYQAYKKGRVILLPRSEVESLHPEIDKRMKSFILIPLFYDEMPTGILNLQSTHSIKYIPASKLHALKLFGSMASLAIRRIQAQHDVEKALETRDLFISMAAHEFRTPLTVIKLYVQMMQKKYLGKSAAETRWVKSLAKETDRLIHLVNELLHVDQIRTGKLKFEAEPCSLKSVLRDAIADSQINYADHVFLFNDWLKDGSDIVHADTHKLVQAFINILNNAAKFSPSGSIVEVGLREETGKLKVTVKDQGAGISSKELHRVFEAFYKSQRNETKEGMGLGLSLVKRIVEQSKGSIEITSKINEGTAVVVQFPAKGQVVYE